MSRLVTTTLCMMLSIVIQAQSLSGTITLAGAENNAVATIRIPDLNIGTTAKLDGTYHIDGIKAGKHTVEYSFIGYKTVRETITWHDNEHKTFDVTMVEEPIMLNALFVTPDGSDPAQYILKKVWEKAEKKHKNLSSFNAKASTVLSFSDFDVIGEVLPSTARSMLLFSAGIFGMKRMVQMILDNPNLHVKATSTVSHVRGNFKWKDAKITECNIAASEKDKATLCKIVDNGDLYNLVYGNDNLLREKKVSVKLKGSYEEQGKFIYVIEGKKGKRHCIMHVKEDTWDVLRLDYRDVIERTIVECKKSVDGLYLPVSINSSLTLYDKTAEEMKKEYEETTANLTGKQQEKVEKKAEKFARKIGKNEEKKERMKNISARIQEHGFHCIVNYGTSIAY